MVGVQRAAHAGLRHRDADRAVVHTREDRVRAGLQYKTTRSALLAAFLMAPPPTPYFTGVVAERVSGEVQSGVGGRRAGSCPAAHGVLSEL